MAPERCSSLLQNKVEVINEHSFCSHLFCKLGRSASKLPLGRIKKILQHSEFGNFHPDPALYPETLCFRGRRAQKGTMGFKTTSPYSEGKPGVLGDAPGPQEDRGAPTSSGHEPSPPEGSILPGHSKDIGNIIIFQFPENLQAKGDRDWSNEGFFSTPTVLAHSHLNLLSHGSLGVNLRGDRSWGINPF